MRRSRFLITFAALAVLGAGVACGGGDNGDKAAAAGKTSESRAAGAVGDSAGGIEVVGTEFSFEPAELTLRAGQPTKIVLKNAGAVEHDITIDDVNFKLVANPTKTTEQKLTIPAAGSYTFYCSVPGHRPAGMEGTVTVS